MEGHEAQSSLKVRLAFIVPVLFAAPGIIGIYPGIKPASQIAMLGFFVVVMLVDYLLRYRLSRYVGPVLIVLAAMPMCYWLAMVISPPYFLEEVIAADGTVTFVKRVSMPGAQVIIGGVGGVVVGVLFVFLYRRWLYISERVDHLWITGLIAVAATMFVVDLFF